MKVAEHGGEGGGEQHRRGHRARADELHVVVAADGRDERAEAEPEGEQVDRRLDRRRERRRAPVGGEVDDLAHEHAEQCGALEPADLGAAHVRDFFPGQEDEDVLEVGGPPLPLGRVAVQAQDGDRRAGPARRLAGGAGLGLDLLEPRRRAEDLDRLATGVLLDQRGRRAAGDGLAVRHDRHVVGEPLRLLDVVRRHQDRRPLAAEAVDQRPELLAHLRVEADGRLVEQDEPRPVHERPRDQQPPPHPAAQLVHPRVGAVRELGDLERAVDRGAALAAAEPVEEREHDQVLLDGQRHVEVVELRDDAALRARLLGVLRQLPAQHLELALVGDRLRREELHRGALAGAVRAEEADARSLGDVEVEAVDGGDRAEALDDAAEADGGGGHPPRVIRRRARAAARRRRRRAR